MSNLATNSENAVAPRKAKAAGRAMWLVLGWLTFWLGTVAYPCQAHPAPPGHLDHTAAFEVAAGQIANSHHPDSHPAHDEGTCHHLSAPAIGAPVTAAGSGNPNVDPAAPVAPELRQLAAAISAPGIVPLPPPVPHTPLYLRTQRLLI